MGNRASCAEVSGGLSLPPLTAEPPPAPEPEPGAGAGAGNPGDYEDLGKEVKGDAGGRADRPGRTRTCVPVPVGVALTCMLHTRPIPACVPCLLSPAHFLLPSEQLLPMLFDGGKIVVQRGLSRHFQTMHTLTFGSAVQPTQWQFGATYAGGTQESESEVGGRGRGLSCQPCSSRRGLLPRQSRPILIGDMSSSGNFTAVLLHQLGASIKTKINLQVTTLTYYTQGKGPCLTHCPPSPYIPTILLCSACSPILPLQTQKSKWVGWQGAMDYKGTDFTASLTLANPDPLAGSAVAVLQYLQAVSSRWVDPAPWPRPPPTRSYHYSPK